MKSRLLLALLLPLAARAQLSLFVENGATETPLGPIFDFGKVPLGNTRDAIFRARNTSSSVLQITTLALSGVGFRLANSPPPPFPISPGNFVDVTVHFTAGILATYSANFQMNSASILVVATAVPQLALFAVNGSTETPLSSTFDLGRVALGFPKDVLFRARNTASSAILVVTLSIAGAGFTLPDQPSIPFTIAPGSFQDVTVHLLGGTPQTYSANFQLNSASVLVLATVVPTATLSSVLGCTGPNPSTGNIDFGTIVSSDARICTFSLRNLSPQTITVSSLATSGSGFQSPQGIRTPFALLAGENVTFTVAFAPGAPNSYSGTLTIEPRTFALSGTAVAPMLPTPLISYDSSPLQSNQQRNLTLSLPLPAPVDASGDVTLSFTPDTQLVNDDPFIVFAATGAHTAALKIRQGDTHVLLNGQPSAIFQTGTTSGKIKIRVSLSSNLTFLGDATTVLTIPPAKTSIDSATGSIRTGFVDLQLVGYDNTYSAGPMSFAFFDLSGRALSGSPLNADFTSGFRDYFSKATAGGVFKALITFPVSGDVTQVGAVEIQFTNSAGSTTLQRLMLPPCQLNGLVCVAP